MSLTPKGHWMGRANTNTEKPAAISKLVAKSLQPGLFHRRPVAFHRPCGRRESVYHPPLAVPVSSVTSPVTSQVRRCGAAPEIAGPARVGVTRAYRHSLVTGSLPNPELVVHAQNGYLTSPMNNVKRNGKARSSQRSRFRLPSGDSFPL